MGSLHDFVVLQPASASGPSHHRVQEATEKPPETDSLQEHSLQAGCAAVVALLMDRTLYVANAGDSRAVLCRAGRAKPMSHDHKPAQVLACAARACCGLDANMAPVCPADGDVHCCPVQQLSPQALH